MVLIKITGENIYDESYLYLDSTNHYIEENLEEGEYILMLEHDGTFQLDTYGESLIEFENIMTEDYSFTRFLE